MHRNNIIRVPTSTQNITGFFIINRGLSFTNDCLKDSLTSEGSNNLIGFLMRLLIVLVRINYIEKYSARGPNAKAGKNDRAATMIITERSTATNAGLSTFSVPALSGI